MPIGYRKQPVKAVVSMVTGSRAFNTIYQNTSGRPMLVIVSCNCVRANAANAYVNYIAYVLSTTPPTTPVCSAGLDTQTGEPDDVKFCLVFAVPNGHYYRVVSQIDALGSSIILAYWGEIEL